MDPSLHPLRRLRAKPAATPLGAILLLLLLLRPAFAGETLHLAGPWQLRLDPEDRGVREQWSANPLPNPATITLPTTTDLAGFGFPLDLQTLRHATNYPTTTRFPGVKEPERADEHGYLVRRHLFVGPAWYEREVVIPRSWKDHSITLRLERALWQTDAWIDGRAAGSHDSLVAEHRHELGVLSPGPHRLTVRVDNRMIYNLSTITHAYGPETQTRWNGLLGQLALEASPPLALRALEAFPAPDRRAVRARMRVANQEGSTRAWSLRVRLLPERNGRALAEKQVTVDCPPGLSEAEVTLNLAEPAQAWDEFQTTRYRLRVTTDPATGTRDPLETTFGFRHVERVGRELRLNGRPLFLRGTLDCAVYPRTGHPPMTVPEWERVLGVVKEYGFNHVRFHTWCPPDAAFEAADRLGVYLQAEAPAWVDDWGTETVTHPLGLGHDPSVANFVRDELRRMSEAYGNHPSFLLCAAGNEFGMNHTDWTQVNGWIEEIKARDSRRLYTACGARRNLPADDFWFTHHTAASTRGVGPAHTDWDFVSAAAASPVPVIAHETGQRPVFPDYARLLPKFTGPLLPLNLERYRRSLVDHGLADQNHDFVEASARFQFQQYKAEHEAMRRTRGYAGYQLLMLNDFTGQSEALVGLLDPFGESKGVIRAAEVRQWNAPSVLLARFPKYVWTTEETFRARLDLAHFGGADLPAGSVQWTLKNRRGQTLGRGSLTTKPIPTGTVTDLGALTRSLRDFAAPQALTLTVRYRELENRWNLWIYPAPQGTQEGPKPPDPGADKVHVTTLFDETARDALRKGGRVLLLAHGVKSPRAATTGFESVYWSAGWWGNRFSSLGLLCDPRHPALAEFPTEAWADWQWRELRTGATTFALDDAPMELRGIVQPVPDFHFNTRLAQVFEVQVGPGALLVCGFDLSTRLAERPAARQLRQSLLDYARSPAFRPAIAAEEAWVQSVCGPR